MQERISKAISVIFHPVLIPTLGFFLLFHSGFYYSAINWEIRRYVLLVVLLSTAILPLISFGILALNPKFDISMKKNRDRILPLLSSSIFYYIGFMLLGRLKAFPVFKLFLIASALVIVALLIISIKWKISMHMAAIGGLTGTLFAISFRTGANPFWIILAVIVVSGLIGTARLVLKKHNLQQIIAGYFLGFSILYLIIYFI